MWNITHASHQSPHWLGQDRVVVRNLSEHCTLVAVMDGHGETSDTVNFCHKFLSAHPLNAPPWHELPMFIDEVYRHLHKETSWRMDGCTLTMGVLFNTGKVFLATLGDSLWIVKNGADIQRGPSHNINTNAYEKERVLAKGAAHRGYHMWVDHVGLQPTRALGDSHFGAVLERLPEIHSFGVREKNEWVALITDGVWDELSDSAQDDYEALVKSLEDGRDASHVVTHHGLAKDDDRAAIVCRFVS